MQKIIENFENLEIILKNYEEICKVFIFSYSFKINFQTIRYLFKIFGAPHPTQIQRLKFWGARGPQAPTDRRRIYFVDTGHLIRKSFKNDFLTVIIIN